jgi:hypothetical protein
MLLSARFSFLGLLLAVFGAAMLDAPLVDAAGSSSGYAAASPSQMPEVPANKKNARQKKTSLPLKKGSIDLGDAQLYYEEAGHGAPLVLLHGHSFDRRMWDPQLAELSRHYRVIRYDMRGYGLSSMPVEGQEFLHANDLFRLLQALHIPKAHLVGLSLGGFVAVDFMALHPAQTLSVVSCSGSLYPHPGPEQPITLR